MNEELLSLRGAHCGWNSRRFLHFNQTRDLITSLTRYVSVSVLESERILRKSCYCRSEFIKLITIRANLVVLRNVDSALVVNVRKCLLTIRL